MNDKNPFNMRERAPGGAGRREPLVDVIEHEEEVVVTADLPGVTKEELKVIVKKRKLIIRVNNPSRPFRRTIDLPYAVSRNGTKSRVKNGVLEVRMPRRRAWWRRAVAPHFRFGGGHLEDDKPSKGVLS